MNTRDVRSEWRIGADVGECPTWIENILYCVDIEGCQLLECGPADQVLRHSFKERIGFALPASDGRWVVGLESGIYVYCLRSKESTLLANPKHPHPENRYNDAACDPQGEGFLVGTLNMGGLAEQAELYDVDSKIRVTTLVDKVGMSNGLVWSITGNLVFFIDSLARRIDAFDWDQARRAVSNRRTVFDLGDILGTPDGMTIDQEGILWVALWGGSAVIGVNPIKGELVDRIELPVSQVTSCCFGGEDYKTLYITTAKMGLNEAQLRNEPRAGDIFTVQLETGGIPVPSFTLDY